VQPGVEQEAPWGNKRHDLAAENSGLVEPYILPLPTCVIASV
jgi:hypothetical protein